jgi:hypothetical protein
MWQSARFRAKKHGVPFELTIGDMPEIPASCPVLGIPIFCGNGRQAANSPSLDRLDPGGGYTPGNVRVISLRANTLRSNATAEELRLILKDLTTGAGGRKAGP